MASPLIKALKTAFPNARIAWLVQSGFEDLLNTHPDLDQVIVWDKSHWHGLWQKKQFGKLINQIKMIRRQLRQAQFDCVIDIQGLLKSGLFAFLSGAQTKIGLGSKEGSQWLMNKVIKKLPNNPRISSEYLDLAKQLNLPCDDFPMHIECSQQDLDYSQQIIKQHHLQNGYVVFCPFTTRPQKHWFNEHWRQLALLIEKKINHKVIVLGGPQDKASANDLCRNQVKLISLAGQTRLRQAQAMMSQAKIVIGVDTGLTHMGIAAQVPCVGLFGSTRPYLHTPGYKAKIIYQAMACSPCRRNPTCHQQYDCMRSISADLVMDSINQMLADKT